MTSWLQSVRSPTSSLPGRTAPSAYFGRRLYVGRLRVCEQRFRKQFARAAGLLDETPLCAQDRCELLLLSRRIPAAVARHVDACVV